MPAMHPWSRRGARQSAWLVASVVLLSAFGCSDSGSGSVRKEKLTKAAGVVTYKGKPVDAGTVSFSNPMNGFSASGEIELAGKFTITLIPAGDYRVSILPPAPKEAVEESKLAKPVTDVPKKYQNAATSGLQASVPEEGVTDLKIELE